MKISNSQIESFKENGALVIPNVFSSSLMDKTVQVFEDLLTRFASECQISRDDYVSIICQFRDLWKYHPLFEQLIFKSSLPHIAAQLMGRPASRLLHDHVISKPKGNSDEVPWHQDYPYWPVDHSSGLSCWLAMDDVDENSGALEIIPGSHLCGEEPPVDFLRNLRNDLSQNESKIQLPVKRGDVVILHSLTWHRTGPNTSLPNRRAYISLWIPPESRYSPLHSDWHPVNYNVKVEPGELLNDDWFPVVGEISKSEIKELPKGIFRVNKPSTEDDDELSMYNASKTIKRRLAEFLAGSGIPEEKWRDKIFQFLLDEENRKLFLSILYQKGLVTQIDLASKCLKELAINSIAWEAHKARNVYNRGYIQFGEIFMK